MAYALIALLAIALIVFIVKVERDFQNRRRFDQIVKRP